MVSLAAKAVAEEVIREVRKGRKAVLRKIAPKHGYSLAVADSPKKITKTKDYQAVIIPFVKKLEVERDRAIDALKGKIGKAKYRDLNDAIDKLTKTHQLLTGGATEHVKVTPIYNGLSRHNSDQKNLPAHKED